MKCPVCKDVTLLMAEKHGVEIDYCPECRGIWLDRGELDKIIERASKYDDRDDRDEKSRNREKPKKKSAFLGDILEIFGGD
ncbi:TFIIB-type zinc ribbon-containing protein [Anaerostipes sp.]|uniref:TFIIB-type zinc ribbon-containing protein n=1 Tax=Anaerostipes sp. TaxID=1872530 RepID=UPI002579EE8F|nr:zf-TFIIB domain-containing protein [Anaerostipes sp.]